MTRLRRTQKSDTEMDSPVLHNRKSLISRGKETHTMSRC